MSETSERRAINQERIARTSIPQLDNLADQLVALVTEIFQQRVSYTSDDGADVMALSFVTKQTEHLRSVRALIAIDAHRDALLIARTMLEGFGRLFWAFARQPERTELWLCFGAILDWRQIQKNEADGMAVDPQEKAALKQYVDAHGPNYIRGGVRKAREKAEREGTDYQMPDDPWGNDWTEVDVRSMFTEIGMVSLYDSSYRTASEWVHWGPRAILRAMESVEWGMEGFTETDWPGAALALLITCTSLHQSLAVLDDQFSLGHADRLAALYEIMKRSLDESVRVGSNN